MLRRKRAVMLRKDECYKVLVEMLLHLEYSPLKTIEKIIMIKTLMLLLIIVLYCP